MNTPSEALTPAKAKLQAAEWFPGAVNQCLAADMQYAVYRKSLFFLRAAAGIDPSETIWRWGATATKEQALEVYDIAIAFALSQETSAHA